MSCQDIRRHACGDKTGYFMTQTQAFPNLNSVFLIPKPNQTTELK